MKHLIIYTHPNPASFNHAIKETLVRALKEKGDEVRVRDLYALGFDPVLKAGDFKALAEGKALPDVALEQGHVLWADQITFLYPLWWDRMPALVEGYVDRVLSKGFAYDYTPKGPVGLLPGKKVALFTTCGAPLQVLESSGVKAMGQLLDRDIFTFCGMDVVLHQYFGSVPTVSQDERKQMLEEVARRAAAWPAAEEVS